MAELSAESLAVIEHDYERVMERNAEVWGNPTAVAYVPMLLAEVRRLREERDALVFAIEGGWMSGRCCSCRMIVGAPGRAVYTHEDDCTLARNGDRLDVTAYTAFLRDVRAEGDVWFRQWEAAHPDMAARLRERMEPPVE